MPSLCPAESGLIFHWALTQDLSVPGHLVLSAEVLLIWTGSPFRREETSLGQVWAVMWHPEHLTWLCRDGGRRAGSKVRQWLEVPFPVPLQESPEQSTVPCEHGSVSIISLSTPVAFAPCGSPCWGSSPPPPGQSPRLPSSCKSPSISCWLLEAEGIGV